MKLIKPKFNLKYHLKCYCILAIPALIPYSIIMQVGYITWSIPLQLVSFCILTAFSMYGLKIFFDGVDFLIEEHKVSYVNRFFNYTVIDIRYEDIKEINLKCDLLQRVCNLGTISMLSNATAKKAGIKFFSIENPLEIYQEIQNKIDQCKNSNN
ncbi:PH domain-containing protein [Rickettsia endosymbiont of Polydrusus tereticollis]|uniref:PH domain-containing protein n=1 Tax=Rickettsia endosymbiont of Polydrusus tereticollis TaxID=3066251 RepID=UPI003132BFB3